MNNKKWLSVLVFLLLIIFISNFVSALDIRRGSEQLVELVIDWSEPLLAALLGGDDYNGQLLFEKLLFFILFMVIVYIAIGRIPVFEDNNGVIWTVAIIVPLLGVRFLDFKWLNTILFEYEVLGIALVGILPFIIYLFFLHNAFPDSSVPRKIGWIFFIVVYFGMWIYGGGQGSAYEEIYFWTMVVSLVFLLLDGTIHRALERQKWVDSKNSGLYDAIAELDKRETKIRDSNIPEREKERQIKKLRKRRKKLYKQIGRF